MSSTPPTARRNPARSIKWLFRLGLQANVCCWRDQDLSSERRNVRFEADYGGNGLGGRRTEAGALRPLGQRRPGWSALLVVHNLRLSYFIICSMRTKSNR
jgi:hypothetical protein